MTQPKRDTSSIIFEAIGGIFTLMIFAVCANLINAIWVMLTLGIAHHQWTAIPAFGYWPTYVLLCGLYAIGGVMRTARTAAPTGGSK